MLLYCSTVCKNLTVTSGVATLGRIYLDGNGVISNKFFNDVFQQREVDQCKYVGRFHDTSLPQPNTIPSSLCFQGNTVTEWMW
eukprot:scaffold16816_cov118-Skeletonema_dohrnii-CCMP3373.AAC.3